MSNPFAQLPIEVIWNILLDMPYLDIMSFCKTGIPEVQEICDSDEFWISKLDKEYTVQSSDDVIHIPSSYITVYRNDEETGRDIYVRWVRGLYIPLPTEFNVTLTYLTDNLNINVDIILFRVDMIGINNIQLMKIIQVLQMLAAQKGSIDLLDKLIQIGGVKSMVLMSIALRYDQMHVADWIFDNKIKQIINYNDFAQLEKGELKLATWLIEHGYHVNLIRPKYIPLEM